MQLFREVKNTGDSQYSRKLHFKCKKVKNTLNQNIDQLGEIHFQ